MSHFYDNDLINTKTENYTEENEFKYLKTCQLAQLKTEKKLQTKDAHLLSACLIFFN